MEWLETALQVWAGMAAFMATVGLPSWRWGAKKIKRWDRTADWFTGGSPVAEAAGGTVQQQLRENRTAIAALGDLSSIRNELADLRHQIDALKGAA